MTLNQKSTIINQKSSPGFTLVEIMVVIFGFSLIAWGMIGLIGHVFYSGNQQAGLLSDSDQARQLAFNITNQLRNAQTAGNGAYVLDTAAAQQIIFYSTINNN